MILGEDGGYYKVFYNGQAYMIDKHEVYNLGEKSEQY